MNTEKTYTEVYIYLNLKPYIQRGYPRKIDVKSSIFYGYAVSMFVIPAFIMLVLEYKGISFLSLMTIIGFFDKSHAIEKKLMRRKLKEHSVNLHFLYKNWLMVLDEEVCLYRLFHNPSLYLKGITKMYVFDITNPHFYSIHKCVNYC